MTQAQKIKDAVDKIINGLLLSEEDKNVKEYQELIRYLSKFIAVPGHYHSGVLHQKIIAANLAVEGALTPAYALAIIGSAVSEALPVLVGVEYCGRTVDAFSVTYADKSVLKFADQEFAVK